MKNLFKRVLIAVIGAVLVFSLAACSSGAPEYNVSAPQYAVTGEHIMETLEDFLDGDRINRTTFTDNERKAAEYIYDKLKNDYGCEESEILDFKVNETNASNLTSQNVVGVYRPHKLAEDKSPKNIVIGAYYDNRYATPYVNAQKGTATNGALSNGSGVAALLSVAEYLMTEKPDIDFTVTMVFFGASAVTMHGVNEYYQKQMTAEEKRNTVLMIELQRLGVDHVYAFSDARKTRREPFFDSVAEKNGLDIYKQTQKSPILTNAYLLNGVPYVQWGMCGMAPVFFNNNIPTLNLMGGNWETMDMRDAESADNPYISNTSADTLANLKKLYPDCGDKMATAATLVIKSITEPDFLSTMQYDRDNFPDTSVLTKDWIWYLIALGIVLIAAAGMYAVNLRLAKKYPLVMPQPKKMKMAVFGMDYEDKKPDEIYIDIRTRTDADDIFPGVPNNDGTVIPFAGGEEKQPEKPDGDNNGGDSRE